MKNLIGIINSGFEARGYQSLLKTRPDYMLPFAGRYRLVDFTLSNFYEHGLSKVMLFGGKNIRSTLDHVGNGKSWGMDKRYDGLMINPPSYSDDSGRATEIKTYFDSLRFFEDSNRDYIYIANPMVVSRIDITKAYNIFVENNYDVMFLHRKQDDRTGQFLNCHKIIFDNENKFINIGQNLGTELIFNMYIENMFIKKDLFIRVVKDSIEKGNADNLIQAIMNVKQDLCVGTLELFRHVEYINDLQSFYRANMNILNHGVYTDLFLVGDGILTKSKDEPSTLYTASNQARESIVANGCIIQGEVERSIIFRGVKIGKNAIVKNSIIFQNTIIEDNAIVVNSILDKNVVIKGNVFVQGTQMNPYVVEKNRVLEA